MTQVTTTATTIGTQVSAMENVVYTTQDTADDAAAYTVEPHPPTPRSGDE